MGRAPCCDKANVKKGPWSPEEDAKLKAYIEQYGTGGNWIALPQKIGLKRCGKSCRLRWLNYLRPNIKHGGFSEEEDNIICNLYISIGSRWSIIAAQLPGRTDNDIKNYWNTRLKKKLLGRRKDSLQARRLNQDHPQDSDQVEDNSSQTLSNSALERLQLHMQLQSIHHPFSFYNHPALWPKLQSLIGDQRLTMHHQGHDHYHNGLMNPTAPPLMQQLLSHQTGRLHELPSSDSVQKEQHDQIESSVNGFSSDQTSSTIGYAVKNINNIAGNYPLMEQATAMMPKPIEGDDHHEQFSKENIHMVSNLQAELKDLLYSKTSGFEEARVDQAMNEFDYYKEMEGNAKESLMWWANDFDTKSSSSNSWDDSANHVVQVPPPEGLLFQDYVLGYDL